MTQAAIALLACVLVVYAAYTPDHKTELLAFLGAVFLLGMLAGRGLLQ